MYAARPRRIADECFIVAAEATADRVGSDLRSKGMLFPSLADIPQTEVTTATRVVEFKFETGLAHERPRDVRAWFEGQLYEPHY
jgi:malate dehydrogenase (oxaloacetate-decarboxylating)(NADP+)